MDNITKYSKYYNNKDIMHKFILIKWKFGWNLEKFLGKYSLPKLTQE